MARTPHGSPGPVSSISRPFLVLVLCACACTRSVSYRVNDGPGYLVIADHRRQTAVITEQHHQRLGVEVMVAQEGGHFVLHERRWMLLGSPVTFLVLSRPGYRTWWGTPQDNKNGPTLVQDRQLQLLPAVSFAEELQATQELARHVRDLERLCGKGELAPEACRLLEENLAKRETHLRLTYPYAYDARAALRPRTVGQLKVNVSSWAAYRGRGTGAVCSTLTSLLSLSGGRLVLAEAGDQRRPPRLVMISPNGEVLVDRALAIPAAPPGRAAHHRPVLGRAAPERLAALVSDGVQLFSSDLRGSPQTVTLRPPLGPEDRAASLHFSERGILLGFNRAANAGPDRPTTGGVRLYHTDGTLEAERSVAELESLTQAALLSDGRLLVAGHTADRGLCPQTLSGTRYVQRSCGRAVYRLEGMASEKGSELLLKGANVFALQGDELWTVLPDLLPEESARALQEHRSAVDPLQARREAVLLLDAEGRALQVRLLSARELGPLRPTVLDVLGHRLAMLNGEPAAADVVELECTGRRCVE